MPPSLSIDLIESLEEVYIKVVHGNFLLFQTIYE